ncbi:MAG TPA: hypothetical protein VF338_12005 [Leptolinea sp.]
MKSESSTPPMNKDQVKSGLIDREPPQKESLPTGPLKLESADARCSLLIFVPRNAISSLINDMTGGYGYSHLAIDLGEIDIPSGKRIMVESTIGMGVHNSFQDEYGERKLVRIPLEKAGVNADDFRVCIHSKLGERYDDEDALTFGLFYNPAKQICSALATVCLPEALRAKIASYHQAGFIHVLSAVRFNVNQNETTHFFVSPNGFAEYFGAPRGEQLTGVDQISEPAVSTKQIPPTASV